MRVAASRIATSQKISFVPKQFLRENADLDSSALNHRRGDVSRVRLDECHNAGLIDLTRRFFL